MTNLELAKSLRYQLFADHGTDVQAAINEAYRYINNISPADRTAASVALHIVLNTVSNAIIANEMGEVK